MTLGRFVGRSLRRLEDARFLRGAGKYTDDFAFPDQTYAAFVRSPHAHAHIVQIHTEAARAIAGVLGVFTARDYLADGCRPMAHGALPTDAIDPRKPAFRYSERPLDEPQLPLASEEVRYVGEAVAVVVAATPALAADAADIVHVEYEPLPVVVDIRDASPEHVALEGDHGDREATEAALNNSEIVLEHEFRSQRIANAQLEPRSVIGAYDAGQDSYLMVAGSQGVTRQHAVLAAALRISPEKLRVVCPDVGGGFGPRSYLYAEQVVVVWAARKLGRPVRWTSTRAEAFLTDYQGRDSLIRARLGLTRDGRIQALAAQCSYNLGAHTIGGYVPIANFSRILSSVYAIPCAAVHVRGVLTHTAPTGPYRGAGRPEAMFVMERLLDLAAQRLGIDRIELRRRNLIRREQLPYATPLGLKYDSGAFEENMQRALELAGWSTFAERRISAGQRGKLAGIGLANYIEAPVGAPHERVTVAINTSEQVVELVAGTQSSGQGHATSFAQVAADQLGVTPEQVRLVTGDTQIVTSGGGTHSDRSMRLAGTLIVDACRELRERGRDLAAQLLEVAPDDLAFNDGRWTAKGTQRSAGIFEIGGLSAEAAFTGRIPAHPTGTAVCEVEVDPETGRVTLTRYTAVDDVGQPINPLILHGQVAGGIVQGLGQALSEHARYEPGVGQLTTGSFLDYALPRAVDVPGFALELTEDPTRGNPLRVKGGGEAGITPSLAAIVNAVVDALAPLGVAHLEMPVRSSGVWQSAKSAQHLRRDQPAQQGAAGS